MADKQIEVELIGRADLSELEDFSAKIEEIKSNTDELNNSAEEAAEGVGNLGDSISGIDDSNVDNISSDFDDVGNSADDAADKVDNLQGSMDLLEASALISISSELSNLGGQAEGMAQEMNTAAISVGQLSTNVGMAEPQMVSLINNISNATFPQNEAIAYASALNQMGVSADRLGDSATNMDRINDATGLGYEKVIKLTQGLQSMGISADNLPASFDAIAYAQSNVTGGADTLQRTLMRQASTINEYGLNVDQVVLIMNKLSQQGVSTTKMGTELSNVLKENNGDLSAIEQSLGLTTGALSNASAVTSEYSGQLQNLADEEAEHKSLLDQVNAAWEDMQLVLSPVLSPLSSVMGLIGQAGSFAVGINGLVQLANSMRGLTLVTYLKTAADYAASAAQWALNAAMDANPVGILILAITALIAILGYLYFNNEQVRAAVDALGAAFMWIVGIITDNVIGTIQWLIDQFNQFTTSLGLNSNDWIQSILAFILFIPQLPLQLGVALTNAIARALGFGNNFVQNMTNAAVRSVSNFMSQIYSLPGQLQNELNNMLSAVGQWAASLPQKFWDAGVQAVQNFLSALGIASPGTMQRMMVWEVTEMARRVPIEGRELVSNIGKLGGDIVDNFNPTLGIDFDDTANASITAIATSNGESSGDTYIFNFNDTVVDNEDRMEAIANYITRKLAFDNKTAGRTV